MTNSGDFRRYANNGAAYDLSLFEAQRNGVAVKEKEQKRRNRFEVVQPGKITYAQLKAEQKECTRFNMKVMAVSLLCFCFLAASVFLFAYTNQLTHEVSSIETEIEKSQSENTRLTSELDAMVSLSQIDDYAVNKLGMVKMKSSQINYIDVSSFKMNREGSFETPEPSDILKNKQVIS